MLCDLAVDNLFQGTLTYATTYLNGLQRKDTSAYALYV